MQEITALTEYDNQFRRTDYEYDLISGNPNYIFYQKGKVDQFIHQYRYDSDNRLKEVFTSNDGQVWDRDVNYEYREDGYLARTELGEMKVQGMDYAYTLHGWIKTLNSGVLNEDFDMGKDGDLDNNAQYDAYEANIHDLHARDVLSYTVGYYTGDYTQISAGVSGYSNMPVAVAGTFATDIDELFNGNITSYISGTTETDGDKLNPLAITYHYDQLHRFKESHVFTHATNIIANNTTADAVRANTTGPGGLGDFEMHVDYDMNGNITGLDRQAQGILNDMDEFTYNYTTNTNKLDYVADAEIGTALLGYDDIQNGQSAGNYTYHDDGSLKADVQEEIAYIDWYPNGLVKRIYRTAPSIQPDLYFEYDPTGNRTLKVEITRTLTVINNAEDWIYTYYANDANGITMAVYELNPDDTDPDILSKKEEMIYGGSRLGMEITAVIVNEALNYLTDCNDDGLASGIIQLGAFTPTTGVNLEIMLNGTEIAEIVWNTANSIESHAENLVADINAVAEGYYAEMIDMGAYVYIRFKESMAGSLQSKVLTLELNNSNSPTYIKRELTIGDCYENRILGNKMYELTNYLGNVMEVITDRKIAHDDPGSANIDYFEADIISYADYYPFGMEMPGRGGQIESYRYGYSGKEKIDEISGSGNSYDYGARMYDARLGRWASVDPLDRFFPSLSAYNYGRNNPIYYTDTDGRIIDPATDRDAYNSAVITTFGAGSLATQYLTRYNNGVIQNITAQEYDQVMASLATADEKAAFKGLYLAANDQVTYTVQLVADAEVVIVAGVETGEPTPVTGMQIEDKGGIIVSPSANGYNIFISEYSSVRIPNNVKISNPSSMFGVYREKSAMMLGGIVATYIDGTGSNVGAECGIQPFDGNRTILQIQMENIFMRTQGMSLWLDGSDFQYPDNSFLTTADAARAQQIPDQLQFICEPLPNGSFEKLNEIGNTRKTNEREGKTQRTKKEKPVTSHGNPFILQ